MLDPFNIVISATFLGFIMLLIVAAVYDIWVYQIPNILSASLAGLFVVAALSSPAPIVWWSHLGGAAVVFVCGLGLYHFNWLGAGDVKLLSAVALFTGFGSLPILLAYVLLTGGALALVLLFLRQVVESVLLLRTSEGKISLPRLLTAGEDVPYGVAIAVGAGLYASELTLLAS